VFKLNPQIHPARFARAKVWLSLLPLCVLTGQVQAQDVDTGLDTGHVDACLRNTGHPSYRYYQVYPATTIQVGQNAQNGDLIGSWITTSMIPAWRCKRRAPYSGIPAQISVQSKLVYVHADLDTAHLGVFVTHDGENYRTSRLGDSYLSKYTLGYIARWRATIDGVTTDWTPLTNYQGILQPGPAVTVTKNTGDEYDIYLETQVHFMKHEDPPSWAPWNGNYLQGLVDPTYAYVHQHSNDSLYPYFVTDSSGSGHYIIPQMEDYTVTFVTQHGTCTTPDVPVTLPTVVADEFNQNPILGTTPFTLEFQSCPAGFHSIGYYLIPATTILDAANGVIALDGSSTATGIGLKLTEDTGTALKFGSANPYPLAYNSATGGTYSADLKVSYYRLGSAPVGSGNVSSSMTVTLQYQ